MCVKKWEVSAEKNWWNQGIFDLNLVIFLRFCFKPLFEHYNSWGWKGKLTQYIHSIRKTLL